MQTLEIEPEKIQQLVRQSSPREKVKLLIKYSTNRNISSAIIAEIGTQMSKDPKLLNKIGRVYKKRLERIEKVNRVKRFFKIKFDERKEKCKEIQRNAFQALIDFHDRNQKTELLD